MTPGYIESFDISGDNLFLAAFTGELYVVDSTFDSNSPYLGGFHDVAWAHGVDVQGDIAYIAQRSGLLTVDISNPESSVLLNTYPTNNDSFNVKVVGDIAYLVAGGVYILDVTDPSSPTEIGRLEIFTEFRDVIVDGTTLYAVNSLGDLVIINADDPSKPTVEGILNQPGVYGGIQLVGSHILLANSSAGLRVIDVSDITSPTLVTSLSTGSKTTSVSVEGDIAYLGDSDFGVVIVDVSDPTTPSIITMHGPGSSGTLVQVHDGILYTNNLGGFFDVIDVSDPFNFENIGYHRVPGGLLNLSMKLDGDTGYFVSRSGGLQILDMSDCPPCPADFTQEGDLNFLDISAFLAAYSSQDTAADFNTDGSFNFLDISEFLSAFAAGCP
jgi:hypothetical protein